jgi:dTDP-4-dehydrorhamnose 3,5-epimerase
MALKIVEKALDGLVLFEPIVHGDDRGFFMETWRADQFEELGIKADFVQDNHSKSQKNVLRGMHFQWDKPLGKLLRVVSGSIKIQEIDIRHNSPNLGKTYKTILSAENKRQLWVPPGFANGFLTLEDDTEVLYKTTALWNPKAESGIRWNDPNLDLKWEINDPIMSVKDKNAQSLNDWLKRDESKLFSL